MRRPLLAILIAAVLFRLIFSLGVTRGIQKIAPETEVTDGYHKIAESLYAGHGYREIAEHPPTLQRPPGYPVFLYFLFGIFGVNYVAVQIVQALLGALGCWLLFLLGRWVLSERLGLAAASLFAIYPSAIEYSARLYAENLYFPIFFAFAYFLCRSIWNGSWKDGLAAGSLWALSLLTRGTLLVLPLLLPVGLILLKTRRRGFAHWRRWVLPAVIGAVVVLTPWTARNASLTGEFVPVSAWGWAPFYHGIQVSKRMLSWGDLAVIDKAAESQRHEIVVQTLYGGDKTKAWESPREYVRHEKVARDLVLKELRDDPLGAAGRAVVGVPFAWFQTLGPRKRLVSLILHLPLMILFVLGVLRMRRASREGFERAVPALIVILSVNLFQAVVFPFVRYMAPAVALSFVFSGLPLFEYVRRVQVEAQHPDPGLQRGAHDRGAPRPGPGDGRRGGKGDRRRR
jgi:4-amino-4-deoxy-L-arabinose transferase-like glycosyltransferase